MKNPIQILKDYLKEIEVVEESCRMNDNKDDLTDIIKIKSEFLFAISGLKKEFTIRQGNKERYVNEKEAKKEDLRKKLLKIQTEKPYYKGRAKKLKPKKEDKEIVLKNGQRIKRLKFLKI